MARDYDWSAFYRALCEHGPRLLLGVNDDVREVIAMLAADTDSLWSVGLEDPLIDGACAGDLRAGVVDALELWRENVLETLYTDFAIELDSTVVTIDSKSPLVDEIVEAMTAQEALEADEPGSEGVGSEYPSACRSKDQQYEHARSQSG